MTTNLYRTCSDPSSYLKDGCLRTTLESRRARLLFFLILLAASSISLAKEADFGIRGDPAGWGGSCVEGPNKVLAGSLFFVSVCNRADQPRVLRSEGWPEGYTLEAALDLPLKAPFAPTPGLIEDLRPNPYLGYAARIQQERLSSGKTNEVDAGWLNLKEFALRIPTGLAGHTITLRARYDKGGQQRYTRPLTPFEVVLPCNRDDSARVMAGEVHLAHETGQLDRIIEIADSMLSVGLSDAQVWKAAMDVAHGRGAFRKEIAYLDQLYKDFGVITFSTSWDPFPSRNNVPNLREQNTYLQLRARLVDLTNQQQQH